MLQFVGQRDRPLYTYRPIAASHRHLFLNTLPARAVASVSGVKTQNASDQLVSSHTHEVSSASTLFCITNPARHTRAGRDLPQLSCTLCWYVAILLMLAGAAEWVDNAASSSNFKQSRIRLAVQMLIAGQC